MQPSIDFFGNGPLCFCPSAANELRELKQFNSEVESFWISRNSTIESQINKELEGTPVALRLKILNWNVPAVMSGISSLFPNCV